MDPLLKKLQFQDRRLTVLGAPAWFAYSKKSSPHHNPELSRDAGWQAPAKR
jgi:hypothetical protein